MTIVAACLKANFSCEWKIFKVIARTLAIIIIEPRENVFYCDFIPDKPSPAIFLFSVEQHIQIIFLLDTRVIVYICASYMLVYAFTKRKKKEYFWWKKKELKEKSLYNSVLRLPALRKSTHTIASLDLSWETFFISSSSYFHLMMLFSPVCLFSLSLLYILCVCCVFKTDFSSTFFVYTFFQHLCSLSLSLSLLSFLPLFILTYRKIFIVHFIMLSLYMLDNIQATLTP